MSTYYKVRIHFRRSGFDKIVPVSHENEAKVIVKYCNESVSNFVHAEYNSVTVPDIESVPNALDALQNLIDEGW